MTREGRKQDASGMGEVSLALQPDPYLRLVDNLILLEDKSGRNIGSQFASNLLLSKLICAAYHSFSLLRVCLVSITLRVAPVHSCKHHTTAHTHADSYNQRVRNPIFLDDIKDK